jgi:hydroxymethylpyrimidine pyrophosphatase-like HAD family hydrolase
VSGAGPAATVPPLVVYTDLDGTLLGPGASLFASAEGGVTLQAAEAVAALREAAVDLVPISGRTEAQVREVARLIGAPGYVAELGGIVRAGDRTYRDHGPAPGPGTPVQAMARSGAAGLLLETFAGRLEPHAPWAFEGRECTMLFRGHVPLEGARSTLERAGLHWLDLHDNGVIRRSFPQLEVKEVHAYHLAPRGVDKASGVRQHGEALGIGRERRAAVGDSPSDAAVAGEVAAVYLVAQSAPGLETSALPANVRLTEASYGDGFAEAVRTLLGRG